MQTVVGDVGEHFGRFHDSECRKIKDQLVALNDHGIGRVQFADLYWHALDDDSFAFQENLDYLANWELLTRQTFPLQPW